MQTRSLLLAAVLLGGVVVPASAQRPAPAEGRLDLVVAAPLDSARRLVRRALRAAELKADTVGEYLLVYREPCDPGFGRATLRTLRAVLLPQAPDTTAVAFFPLKERFTPTNRCRGETPERTWIAAGDDGAEGKLWRRLTSAVRALEAGGAVRAPAAAPVPDPDRSISLAQTPYVRYLRATPDAIRARLVAAMHARRLPPSRVDRYQLQTWICRDREQEAVHVVLLPVDSAVTKVLVAGERVKISDGFLNFSGDCDGGAWRRTFVQDGDDERTLLRDMRMLATVLQEFPAAEGDPLPAMPGRRDRAREQQLARDAAIDRGYVELPVPLPAARDRVAALFADQRLLPILSGADRVQWYWCGADEEALKNRDVETLLRAQLTTLDSVRTAVTFRVFQTDLDRLNLSLEEKNDCPSITNPGETARNRVTSRLEPVLWARVAAMGEALAAAVPGASAPVLDQTTR